MVEEKNKSTEELKLVQIPTQTTNAFQIGDRIMNFEELLVEIYNKVSKLERTIT